MNAAFVNPFIGSLKNILSTMAGIDITIEKPERKVSESARGDVSGIIGMAGPQVRGSMAITFTQEMAFAVMEKMLGEKVTVLNDDVRDMIGEITNMVCGGAKSELHEQGFDFEMAVPVVVSGSNHTISHKVVGPKLLLTFNSEFGAAFIEICFNRKVDVDRVKK